MNFIRIDGAILDEDHVFARAADDDDEQRLMRIISRWMRLYLCQPNRRLGRSGAVCPFTAPALRIGAVRVAIAPAAARSVDALSLLALEAKGHVLAAVDAAVDEQTREHQATLLLLPHLNSAAGHALIELVQRRLKRCFVADGLMFGQFYQGCPEPGLANPAFRPLQSPIPLLAIRRMVASDLAFLRDPVLRPFWEARFGREARPRVPAAAING